ncbi:uncharacterized protein EV154DRAFT_538390 [Mucor mucedo]|uniref:uncharacterized protein n=1 Tax=Mucor mucedo TaxID=29922 RepID=UPI00221FE5EE|nr:uncharacterized protein EV154DRAFT_538390 [Mucor mucedo]KAI7890556.1 hypothetical protein EV154DRAFT_538390 [Mucor mucedo]
MIYVAIVLPLYISCSVEAYCCSSVSGLFIEDSHPGEVRLQAICDKLKLLHKDDKSYYNADGIMINNKHEIEIAIVETTGPFHFPNIPKETQDYIKAVSMLHCIDRNFPYGDFGTFKKIGVFFIQVTRIANNFKKHQFTLVHEENNNGNVRSNRRFRKFPYQKHEDKA